MKICFLTTVMFNEGGVSRVLSALASELSKNYNVTVAAFENPANEDRTKYNLPDGDFVLWEDALFFHNSFVIEHGSLSELKKDIERFAGFAQEHGFHIILDGVFTPFDDEPKFAYMYFVPGENGVEIVSAKY